MGQPKPALYVVIVLVMLAFAGYAAKRFGWIGGKQAQAVAMQVNHASNPPDAIPPDPSAKPAVSEDPSPANSQPLTTKTDFKFTQATKLPDVKGISAYRPLVDNTVRFALNVWAGWGPIILANDGFKPGKIWKTSDGKEFKVELVLIDDPIVMRDAYAAGEIHIGWGTLDMVPLFMESFVDRLGKPKDARVMPRVYQQIDYSNGGDGIVVRDYVKKLEDLRGKKVVLAQNSPSHFFLLSMLELAGMQPGDVEMVFTQDAFQAAAAFNAQKDIAACVSWSPDIYNLASARGNRMLVTSGTANKVLADIWYSRADFAKDYPTYCEALVRGIFDAMHELKSDERKSYCANLMADGYNLPAADAIKMFADAHSTNWAENQQFFLNPTNQANFESTWKRSYQLYRRVGVITHQPVPYSAVMDASIIEKLGKVDKYKNSKDEYEVKMAAKSATQVRAESDEVLTKSIVINFFPNSWDPHKKITKTETDVDGKTKDVEVAYDPNAKNVLKDVAEMTSKVGASRILIRGHTDSSMKEKVHDPGLPKFVKELSDKRAISIKDALVDTPFNMDPNRFATEGVGWDEPADMQDPDNQAKNRRVEIKVFTAEKQ